MAKAKAKTAPKRARRARVTETDVAQMRSVLDEVTGPMNTPLVAKKENFFPKFGFHRKSGEKKPCAWMFPGKPWPGYRVELEMVTDKKSAKLGIKSGPAVRLCFGEDEPGPLVSVSSPEDAIKIGRNFLDCIEKDGESAKACAFEKTKDVPHTIAGLRRRKKR